MIQAQLSHSRTCMLCAILALGLGCGQAWGSEDGKQATPKISPWVLFNNLPYDVTRQVSASLLIIGLSFVGKTIWDYCITPSQNTPLLNAKQYSDYLEETRSPEMRATLLTQLRNNAANIRHLNAKEVGVFLTMQKRATRYNDPMTASFLDAKFCELNKTNEPAAFVALQKKLATLKQAAEAQKNNPFQENTETISGQNLKTIAKG